MYGDTEELVANNDDELECENVDVEQAEPSEADDEKKPKDYATTMKKVVWLCLFNGILWVWCSYILAALDKVQIAESLSQVAVTEIIGVVLVYAIKSLIENLSKNNKWPDKPDKDDASDLG